MRLLAVALLLLSLAACTTRRAPVFSSAFRIARIGGEPKLLAPSIAESHPPAEPVRLSSGKPRRARADCVESGPLFRFAASSNGAWTAQVPGPATAPEAVQDDLDLLLTRLDALEARGCLPRGQAAAAGSLIEDTLAVPPNQSLFYRLRYRAEGRMDLLPGVAVKVERAWFRPGEDGQIVKDIQHYIGTSTHHYEIARNPRGRIAFQHAASEQSGPLPANRSLPDARLAAALKPMPFARLFLLGQAVARHIDRVAMIVEAPSREALSAATEVIRKQPDIGCAPALLAHRVSCVTFEGSVVISPEVRVFGQGAALHVAAGTQLRNLPGLPTEPLATLRVERLFHGSYYPVKFAPGDPVMLTLTLASGDRVTW